MSGPAPLADALRAAVSDYAGFRAIAEGLAWVDVREWHSSFQSRALGAALDMLEFPPGYLGAHLAEGYVRALLSGMAFSEEWEPGFWNIPRRERERCLTLGRQMYEQYAIVRELRLASRTWGHLARELAFFTPDNQQELAEYLDCMAGGAVVEIGGSYYNDYVYFAVKGDRGLLASCGVWD